MEEHPPGSDFPETAETRGVPSNLPAPDPSTDVTRAETPATAAPTDATTPTATAKPGEPETTAPAATAPTDTTPQGEKPAPAPTVTSKPTFALDEPLALVESGPTWTRGQVIEGLKERHALQSEAVGWQGLFRVPLDKAKETWEPIIEAIVTRPEALGFLDDYLFSDPAKGQYLEECARYYDTQAPPAATAAPARTPTAAQITDPALRARVQYLENRDAQRETLAIKDRLNREARTSSRSTRSLIRTGARGRP